MRVAAERDVAAQAQRPQVRLAYASLRPSSQAASSFRIAGFDLGRPGKAHAVAADREMAAQLHLRKAGRAELEAIEIPAVGVGADVAAQIDDAVAAERDLIDADADLDRNGGAEGAAGQLPRSCAMAAAGGGAAAVAAGERAVEIDLPARQHAVEARALAEFEIGDAGELEPLLFRAVLEFELLHQRRGRARLDLAAQRARAGSARSSLRAAMPTGRVRLNVPSNFGSAPASASMPSASMLSG